MPKTEAERKTLKEFVSEYGEKLGTQYYYAKRNKSKKFDRSQGGGFSSKAEWWAERLTNLPPSYKSRVLQQLKEDPNLHWWTKRILAVSKILGD